MSFQISSGNVPDIAEGTYKGQLLRVERGVQTSFGEACKWFWLVDVNGKGEELSSMTSMNTGPKSKAYSYLTALIGRSPQAGETIEDPTGKTVLLEINKNDKGFSNVVNVHPFVNPVQTEAGIPR